MARPQTLTPVFAPGPLWSTVLLAAAVALTVALFHAVNGWVETKARAALQVPAAIEVLEALEPHDARPGPLDTQSDYALSAAWGVFDPLAATPAECTDPAPLVALLKGLVCIERAFQTENLRLPERLQMDPYCNFTRFAFGIPHSDLEDTRSPPSQPGIDTTMEKLVQTVLGVEPAAGWRWWTGVRSYARDRSLGAEVSHKKQETVLAEWASPDGEDVGLLYWIYVQQDAPDTLRANPACRALIESFDGFAETILSAHRRAQDAVAGARWTLRSINGPLQFAMIALFLWGILRLAKRRLKGRAAVPVARTVLLLHHGILWGAWLVERSAELWRLVTRQAPSPPDQAEKTADAAGQEANGGTRRAGWARCVARWAEAVMARDNPAATQADWAMQIDAYRDAGSAEAAMTSAQEISEKALERWLAEVIPMLGFLGTVIGMILAMDRVGEVVAASPGVELDAAMDGITGALSVAFFTTFIGLIASLVLILLQGLQAGWEHDRIRLGLQGADAERRRTAPQADGEATS